MATNIGSTEFQNLLKLWYLDFGASELLDDFPLLSAVKKNEKVGGYTMQQAVALNGASAARRATDFTAAVNGASQQNSVQFTIPFVKNYIISDIQSVLFAQSEAGPNAAYISAAEEILIEDIRLLKQSLAIQLYRDGSGYVSTVGSSANVSATYVALNYADDVNLFNVGEVVSAVSVTATGGSTGTLRVGTATVADIDTSAGALGFTTVGNSSITLLTPGDYLYKAASDAQNGASAPVVMTGLLGWCPASTAALTASFFGVTRSTFGRRGTAGLYVPNTTQQTMQESFNNGVAKFQAQGGVIKAIYMHPTDLATLQNGLDTQVLRNDKSDTTVIGNNKIGVATPRGIVTVVGDVYCPRGYAFALDTDNIILCSMGPMVRPIDFDGLGLFVRGSTTDTVQMRHGFYGNLTVRMPQKSICVIQL